VVLVSPEATDALADQVGESMSWLRRDFQESDLDGATLVIAATDLDDVNADVVAGARSRGIWVNDATSLDRSDFILPASIRRGSLTVAVSTDGGSPAYARLVREMLEGEFGDEHARMVDLLRELRPRVVEAFSEAADRKAFWDRLVTAETVEMIKNGDIEILRERVSVWLSS